MENTPFEVFGEESWDLFYIFFSKINIFSIEYFFSNSIVSSTSMEIDLKCKEKVEWT